MNENDNGDLRQTEPSSTATKRAKKKSDASFRNSWESWTRKLKKRKRPLSIAELHKCGRTSPLRWGMSTSTGEVSNSDGSHAYDTNTYKTNTYNIVQQFYAVSRSRNGKSIDAVNQLDAWLDDSKVREPGVDFALEVLAILHALPNMAETLTAAPWWSVLDRMLDLVGESKSISLAEDPLAYQLWRAEVPLTLAFQFPELSACKSLRKKAERRLAKSIDEALDGVGLVQAAYIELMRPLMASWTRSLKLCRTLGENPLDSDQALQLEWMVRQVLRLTRRDGTAAFTGAGSEPLSPRFLEALLENTADCDDKRIAEVILPGKKQDASQINVAKLPSPAERSEWAEVAVLRSSWAPIREKLFVTFQDQKLQVELDCGQTIFSGSWLPQVMVDGLPCGPDSQWQETCWFSDDDVDYLEIETDLERGVVLQRQFLLSRSDRFLFIADVVVPEQAADIDYRCDLPLVSNLDVDTFDETREMRIKDKKSLAWVVPLELPEWRSQKANGNLQRDAQSLVYTQHRHGRNLYAPLFFDLEPRRLNKPITWRQLTVAEKLEIQPRDVAAGYRVQVGRRQWLLYRSLIGAASRTILGQHLSSEFFVGRFDELGETTELVSIS